MLGTDLEEYELRMSQTAMMMRMSSGKFDYSEQEFRDVFAVKKEFDELFSPLTFNSSDPDQREARKEAEQLMKDTIVEVLGNDRYRIYKYEQSLQSSSLRGIVKEYDIPREQVYDVYDIKDIAENKASEIRQNGGLTPEQSTAALDALRGETERSIGNIIGTEARDDYIEKGSWIRRLNPESQSTQIRMDPEMRARYGLE